MSDLELSRELVSSWTLLIAADSPKHEHLRRVHPPVRAATKALSSIGTWPPSCGLLLGLDLRPRLTCTRTVLLRCCAAAVVVTAASATAAVFIYLYYLLLLRLLLLLLSLPVIHFLYLMLL